MGKLMLLLFALVLLLAASSAFSNFVISHNRFTRSDSGKKNVAGEKSAKKCAECYKGYVDSLYPDPKDQRCSKYYVNILDIDPVVTAVSGEFPFMAAIGFKVESNISYECAGALISENYVITPVHCGFTRALGTPKVVRVGTLLPYAEESEAQEVKVAEVRVHPDYKPSSRYHNLALIKLEEPVSFNRHVLPACLSNDDSHVSKGTTVGWTWFGTERDLTKVALSKSTMVTVSAEKCNKSYPVSRFLRRGIDDTQLCTKWQRETDHFISPMGVFVTENSQAHCLFTLIGVSSFGPNFLQDLPNVNQKVYPYLDWIESIVWP